jgi:hypothetical protein
MKGNNGLAAQQDEDKEQAEAQKNRKRWEIKILGQNQPADITAKAESNAIQIPLLVGSDHLKLARPRLTP